MLAEIGVFRRLRDEMRVVPAWRYDTGPGHGWNELTQSSNRIWNGAIRDRGSGDARRGSRGSSADRRPDWPGSSRYECGSEAPSGHL